MASPIPDADDKPSSSSSPQDDSAASDLVSKIKEKTLARLAAHENDPPRRPKVKPTPGPWPQNHGGPIRILSREGVLTEYGKKVAEQERLAKLAATNENEGEKKAESSS